MRRLCIDIINAQIYGVALINIILIPGIDGDDINESEKCEGNDDEQHDSDDNEKTTYA